MVNVTEKVPPPKRITRWHWERLNAAQNKQDLMALLAEMQQNLAEEDVEVHISISPNQYIRLMQLSWMAKRMKEIEQGNIESLISRSLQVYEFYLKQMVISQRGA
ncbi:MAG: hypothetical protein WC551_08175 [Patescibacteria group bacterium]